MGIALAHVGSAFNAPALISHPAEGCRLHPIPRPPDADNKVHTLPFPRRCQSCWLRVGAVRCRQTLMEG
jgi:hypothetical protein